MNNLTTPALGYLTDILSKIDKGFKGTIEGFMGGGRKASKTTSVLKFRCAMLFLPSSVKCYVVRYEVSGATETFAELLEHIPEDWHPWLTINKTNRTITHSNGNELRVLGYKSNQKKGVGKLGIKRGKTVDIVCLDIDEIYEFRNKQEVQDIVEALGSGEVYWRNDMTNTWSPSHWRLAQAINEHKQNANLLKMKGEDFKLIANTDKFIKYSHYTNHRINVFLPDTEHQKLIDLHKTDPRRAMVADLGMFGVESGGIYSSYMDKVSEPPTSYVPHEFFVGIDVGIRKDATTAVLMSTNSARTQICYHNEYYFSDEEQLYMIDGQELTYTTKTQDDRAKDIVRFVLMWTKQHNITLHQNKLMMYVDHSSSFYEDLNRVSKAQRIGHYYVAEPCIKPRIKKRIDLFHFLMANRSFYMSAKCPKLMEELNLSKYDDNQGTKKEVASRLDGRDHVLNAAEYALTDIFWDILESPQAEYYK